MDTELFSEDLERRQRATMAAEDGASVKRWPLGCGGAANAFLVLLGPSMGGAVVGETVAVGGENRPDHKPMRIGPDVMSFDWGDHRKTRWTRLCSEMLGGEQYVHSLTALLNLDWRHSTEEKDVPEEELSRGFTDYVWPLLQQLRPRIVCPLTNRVWQTVLPTIEALRVPFPRCPVPLSREPVVFRLEGCEFQTMLVKPHNHPSRSFLSSGQIVQLGEACRWFLAGPPNNEMRTRPAQATEPRR